ncbi:MAG: hypothetical protein JWR38_5060 [Mucilaginibacter sp.]|nr:hypothetical protein [Mucilaginibacter sp.]
MGGDFNNAKVDNFRHLNKKCLNVFIDVLFFYYNSIWLPAFSLDVFYKLTCIVLRRIANSGQVRRISKPNTLCSVLLQFFRHKQI